MSPEFISSRRVNRPASGMYARNAFAILQKLGSVRESLFLYQDRDTKPPKSVKKASKSARIADYAKINSAQGLKRALLESGPAVIVLPCYSSSEKFWQPVENRVTVGGHAVAVVGYTQSGFILRNSWGDD
eukprot:TRINITY_DN1780_c0_g1_i12.p1 TRINITY_DN1780_c0_g1~~TRINITY_DN1780_c0_g1_i12.p1  ORF type:complete len:130 (-),score=7.83 TRINITY_DN1780_c0_g1_i12:356-745(-)